MPNKMTLGEFSGFGLVDAERESDRLDRLVSMTGLVADDRQATAVDLGLYQTFTRLAADMRRARRGKLDGVQMTTDRRIMLHLPDDNAPEYQPERDNLPDYAEFVMRYGKMPVSGTWFAYPDRIYQPSGIPKLENCRCLPLHGLRLQRAARVRDASTSGPVRSSDCSSVVLFRAADRLSVYIP